MRRQYRESRGVGAVKDTCAGCRQPFMDHVNGACPPPSDPEELRDIARGNIERNAEWDEEASADTIYDECYTLAFDALHDAGVEQQAARALAREVAMSYAQP